MKIDLHATLRAHNTFGFDVSADYLAYLTEADQIPLFIQNAEEQQAPWQVFGGGSNLVLAADLQGYTGLMQIRGRRLLNQTDKHVFIEANAGEDWHEFVAWTLEQGYGGLENLALIPGSVGATPIQNIGAYGLELSQVMDSLEAFDTKTKNWVQLTVAQCEFSYRHSIFKNDPKRYIVSSVCFKLPKLWQPNLTYAELAKAFAEKVEKKQRITPEDIFDKVCEIRSAKLPNPKILGNSGSFFHNPIVTSDQHQELKNRYPNLVAYPANLTGDDWKLAAGWLIDQCGFKGYQSGCVGVYEKQALVLVNHGGGTGKELLALAQQIQVKVFDTFQVQLTIEPVIYS
jgi:UDP-N-acetylmuramate dehydrogenase